MDIASTNIGDLLVGSSANYFGNGGGYKFFCCADGNGSVVVMVAEWANQVVEIKGWSSGL